MNQRGRLPTKKRKIQQAYANALNLFNPFSSTVGLSCDRLRGGERLRQQQSVSTAPELTVDANFHEAPHVNDVAQNWNNEEELYWKEENEEELYWKEENEGIITNLDDHDDDVVSIQSHNDNDNDDDQSYSDEELAEVDRVLNLDLGLITSNINKLLELMPNTCADFNIAEDFESLHFMISTSRLGQCAELDDSLPFVSYNKPTINQLSKGEFARNLQQIFNRNSLTIQAQEQIVQYLRYALPAEINVPSTYHNLRSYSRPIGREYKSYDCCSKGCCVYVGENSQLSNCPKCSSLRYRPCTKCNSIDGTCAHVGKTPYFKVQYRSLVGLFHRLLQNEDFVSLCRHENLFAKTAEDFDEFLFDVKYASVYKKNEQEMEAKFHKLKANGDENVKYCSMLNLLLGHFYDGGQIHKSKVTPFWPILVTILNLPPELRGKVGVGTFLLSIIAVGSAMAGGVQDFIYKDCFVAELEMLYDGITIVVDKTRKYFLQARLIMHSMDGKAIEDFLKVQGSNSKSGCPFCRSLPGTSRSLIKRTFMLDHRHLLDSQHFLRSVGQSGLCCPKEFYTVNDISQWEGEVTGISNPNFQPKINRSDFEGRICDNNPRPIVSFLKQSRKTFIWHHDDSTIPSWSDAKKAFSECLYYPHCNYKQYKKYSRVSNQQYLNDGISYLEGQQALAAHPKHVNGVRGLWPFARLPYTDISIMVCWDPFHVIANIAKNILQCLTRERANVAESNTRQYCKQLGVHPAYHPLSNQNFPWALSNADILRVDEYFNALLVPVGASSRMEIRYPLQRLGFLKGVAKIHIMSNYMDYLLIATKLPSGYKSFLSMLSHDISLLLRPFIRKDEVDTLFKKIVESVCVHEGLYPDSEHTFSFHELVDLAPQLPLFGPCRGWWTLYGERAMSVIKRCVPQGGTSYNLTTFERYMELEVGINIDSYKNAIQRYICSPSWTEGTSLLSVSIYGTTFTHPMYRNKRNGCKELEFSVFDLRHLLEMLLQEVEARCESYKAALKRSSLFFLVQSFVLKVEQNEHRPRSSAVADELNIEDFVKYISAIDPNNIVQSGIYEKDSEYEVYQKLAEGKVYAEGVQVGIQLLSLKARMYSKAVVGGTPLRGRGWSYREFSSPRVAQNWYAGSNQDLERFPKNKTNILKDTWFQPHHYSCWCPLLTTELISTDILKRYWFYDPNKNRAIVFGPNGSQRRQRALFALINAFMVLELSADKLLSNISCASVTCRYYKDKENIKYIPITNDSESYVDNKHFVPIHHIFPSTISVAGFKESKQQGGYDQPIIFRQHADCTSGVNNAVRVDEVDYIAVIEVDPATGKAITETLPPYGADKKESNFFTPIEPDQMDASVVLKYNGSIK
jgi:hypothetical protein